MKLKEKLKKFKNDPKYRKNILAYYFVETPYRLWMKLRHNKVPAVYKPMTYKYSDYLKSGEYFNEETESEFEVVRRRGKTNVKESHKKN